MPNHVWVEILAVIEQISPETAATIRPPEPPEKIEELAESLGCDLPPAFRSYLETFGGQTEEGDRHPLLGANRFLSVDEILDTRYMMLDYFLGEPAAYRNENKIRLMLWDTLWVPFSDLDGYRIVMDLNPGKNGTMSQIFQFWPGYGMEDDETVISPSFEAFSAEVLRLLKAGEYHHEEGLLFLDGQDGPPWLIRGTFTATPTRRPISNPKAGPVKWYTVVGKLATRYLWVEAESPVRPSMAGRYSPMAARSSG